MNYRAKILNRLQIELKKEERKPLLFSVLVMLFFLVLVVFFLIPSLDIITTLRNRNSELKAKEEELSLIYKSYKTASDYYGLVRDRATVFEQNIPEDADPYYFVKQINNIGIKNNVNLKTLRLITKDGGEEGYDVTVVGSYANIQGFFKDLKQDYRYFSTEYLSLKPGNEIKDLDNLSLNAKIYIFYKL